MKIILLEDVKSLGKKGEIQTVSDGYARSLITKKQALEANGKNLNDLKLQNQHAEKVAEENYQKSLELQKVIEASKVTVELKMGEGGKIFGSVSTKEIAEAAKKQLNLDLDKKKMHLEENLKTLGTYEVPVKVHPKVTAKLKVSVVEGK